ncbi:MAG TPA: O-methyltransferase [Anaeromyxobacteraceae bacterium]|nr:O-methyltransferase [Anaeromyxobacteraceae bacterium]
MGSPPVKGFGQGDAALAAWAQEVYAPEDAVLREIRERSAAEGLPPIQVGAMDGLHLEVLARACGARRAVEIGTLGGYSGVCLLRGMDGGVLHTFEIDPARAAFARVSFERAGLADRVRIHVGPALERLAEVEGDGPFDLVFVDADKGGYPRYLAWAEANLRLGGLVLADNTFGFGHVHDRGWRGDDAPSMEPLRSFSGRLAGGGRFRATLLPTAEGLSLGVKVR